MRNTASSGNPRWRVSFSSRADSGSRPNGFSTTTREQPVSSTRCRPVTTSSNSSGGMARKKSGALAPTSRNRSASWSNVASSR